MKTSERGGFFICFIVLLCLTLGSSSASGAAAGNLDTILQNLRSSDEQARAEALKGLEKVRNKKLIDSLLRILDDQDEDWNLRIGAMRLLAETGEAAVADSLMNALNDFCPAIRWNAALGLGRFKGSYRVVNSLLFALEDGDLHVRGAAIQSLGEIGDPEAAVPLVSYLGDRNAAIRLGAISSLRKIADPVAIPFLKRVAYEDSDPVVKGEALSAIIDLTREGKSARQPSAAAPAGDRP